MPIVWTKALAKCGLSLRSLVGSFCVLIPSLGFSLDMSIPVGLQQIGQRLDLKSTLNSIPEGSESQLRSTCLTARYYSLESNKYSEDLAVSHEVLVNFDPTIRRGGLLEFKSVMPVNSALIELELVSECPLVVFKYRWPIIMKQGAEKVDEVIAPNTVKQSSVFDPKSSSLLANSRRPPPSSNEKTPRWMNDKTQIQREGLEQKAIKEQKEIEKQLLAAQAMAEAAVINSAPIFTPPAEDIVRTSLTEGQNTSGEMAQSQNLVVTKEEKHLGDPPQPWLIPVLLGGSALLLFAMVAYRNHALKRGGSSPRKPVAQPQDLVSKSREHAVAFSAEPQVSGNHRVLESLWGNDDHYLSDDLDKGVHATKPNSTDPVQKSSLTISLELINRADIPGWKLPSSYQDLVESRNRSLELHRTPEALLLRAQIGLVELAFQDAKQGMLTEAQTSHDLLEQILGNRLQEFESTPNLYVPDVVKSHVQAKMCEVTGAAKRQLLRENLVNLNKQISSSALCFGSNAWREFLSEEGILE